eukprot:2502825-Rhodomonas_salina.2
MLKFLSGQCQSLESSSAELSCTEETNLCWSDAKPEADKKVTRERRVDALGTQQKDLTALKAAAQQSRSARAPIRPRASAKWS